MGYIRADNVIKHLCEPLRHCLKDGDAYVRKTAVMCVVKLYDFNRELVIEEGFLDQLRELLSDANSMVCIANIDQ
jgi:AP-1 complex subunit beta-1